MSVRTHEEIDAIWDPIIAEQNRIQGPTVMQLIRDAARAEEVFPIEELEEYAERTRK